MIICVLKGESRDLGNCRRPKSVYVCLCVLKILDLKGFEDPKFIPHHLCDSFLMLVCSEDCFCFIILILDDCVMCFTHCFSVRKFRVFIVFYCYFFFFLCVCLVCVLKIQGVKEFEEL